MLPTGIEVPRANRPVGPAARAVANRAGVLVAPGGGTAGRKSFACLSAAQASTACAVPVRAGMGPSPLPRAPPHSFGMGLFNPSVSLISRGTYKGGLSETSEKTLQASVKLRIFHRARRRHRTERSSAEMASPQAMARRAALGRGHKGLPTGAAAPLLIENIISLMLRGAGIFWSAAIHRRFGRRDLSRRHARAVAFRGGPTSRPVKSGDKSPHSIIGLPRNISYKQMFLSQIPRSNGRKKAQKAQKYNVE